MDATGQSLAYVYGRETRADADTANVFTMDEARRFAANYHASRNNLFFPDPRKLPNPREGERFEVFAPEPVWLLAVFAL
jgi:hypothetical protein